MKIKQEYGNRICENLTQSKGLTQWFKADIIIVIYGGFTAVFLLHTLKDFTFHTSKRFVDVFLLHPFFGTGTKV